MTDFYPMPASTGVATEEESQSSPASDIVQEIMMGYTLKEIYGIPDDVLDAVYAHAYNFYQKGNLDHAEEFFQFLCMHDMYNTKYIFGLASVYLQKKNHAKAAQLFALCGLLENDNYEAMFFAGQCNLAIKELLLAKTCFNYLTGRNVPEALKNQAEAYLAALANVEE